MFIWRLVLVTKRNEGVNTDFRAKDRNVFFVIDYKRDIVDDVVSYSGMENIIW